MKLFLKYVSLLWIIGCISIKTIYSQEIKKYNYFGEIGLELKINRPESKYVTDILFNLNFEFEINQSSLYGIYFCLNMPRTKNEIHNKLDIEFLNDPDKITDLTKFFVSTIQIGPVYTRYWSNGKFACYSNITSGIAFNARMSFRHISQYHDLSIHDTKFRTGYYSRITAGVGRYVKFKGYQPEFFGLSIGLNHININNTVSEYSKFTISSGELVEKTLVEDYNYFGFNILVSFIVNLDSFSRL